MTWSIQLRTEGFEGFADDLLKSARKTSRTALSKAAAILARRMRENLNRRASPSTPGDPPARVTGALRASIGRDRPRWGDGVMSVAVGVGQGKAAMRRVEEWKAQGVNVFEYASLHEHGGMGADGRIYPPRSYARAAEMVAEPEMISAMADVIAHADEGFVLDNIDEDGGE
jgi:hypothetical protein